MNDLNLGCGLVLAALVVCFYLLVAQAFEFHALAGLFLSAMGLASILCAVALAVFVNE